MKFSKEEIDAIYALTEKITGTCQQGVFRKDILVSNVERRVRALNCASLAEYLLWVQKNPGEYSQLLSALTIHTTSWLRESPHFDFIEKHIKNKLSEGISHFRIYSAACSSGEEVFSLALVLWQLRLEHKETFDFEIFGTDIDPLCISRATESIYTSDAMRQIPTRYHSYLLTGSGPYEGKFTLIEDIRKRCTFSLKSLTDPKSYGAENFDIVMCRNALIYFSPKEVDKICQRLASDLKIGGMFVLGHSEAFAEQPNYLEALGNAVYVKSAKVEKRISRMKLSHALVVDDSRTIRAQIGKILRSKGFQVTEAASAADADAVSASKRFDLITLDIHMPGENGISWMKRKRQEGLRSPILIVSDSTPEEAEKVFGALENGADDYILKGRLSSDQAAIAELFIELSQSNEMREASQQSSLYALPKYNGDQRPEIVLIGASTGGPEALGKLLSAFPIDAPPVVVVQHICHEFSPQFADRMALISGLKPGEPSETKALERGHIYLSRGDYHLELVQRGSELYLQKQLSEKQSGHRPSVDILFQSAAKCQIEKLAVLLTGMGADGAKGMLELFRSQHSYNLVQNEASCVVFGMPKVAIDLGAAHFVANIADLRAEIIHRIKLKSQKAA